MLESKSETVAPIGIEELAQEAILGRFGEPPLNPWAWIRARPALAFR